MTARRPRTGAKVTTRSEPRLTGALFALVDPDERDHALAALREGMPADAMAGTVDRLIVEPLLEWIDREYQRAGMRHHNGTEAGAALLNAAEEITYRCRSEMDVCPELLGALEARWSEWIASMAQGSAALLWRDQSGRDAARSNGGKGRTGKMAPLTATIRAMLAAMDDRRPDVVRAEMEIDADGEEGVLTTLRGKGFPCVKFVEVTVENYTFIDANGKTETRTFKTLQNLISQTEK